MELSLEKTLVMAIFLILQYTTSFGGVVAMFTNETDRLALLAFKVRIKSDPSRVLSSWNDSLHFCQWQGITCSHRHLRVIFFNISSQIISGPISPHIANLTFLRQIDLSKNAFHSEIQQEIVQLFRLQLIDLSSNALQGGIPAYLSYLSELIQLELSNNKLEGSLPHQLGTLRNLKVLSISNASLYGPIAPSLGNLSFLEVLSLSNNNLFGVIPYELGQLRSLQNFEFAYNTLVGIIPPPIFNLSEMGVFNVIDNQLSGTLPANLGHALPNLEFLVIAKNKFIGQIPHSLSNASWLTLLSLSSNKFIGSVPTSLGSLYYLQKLNMWNNKLGYNKEGDLRFLTSLGNVSSLKFLALSQNNLGGALPNSVSNLSSQLVTLDIGFNKIYGSIPDEIDKLINLNELNNLVLLAVDSNRISGKIPSSMGNLTQLSELYLEENDLSGMIPSSLGNCTLLQRLNLSHNKLHGSIPKAIISLSSLVALDLGHNSLGGSLHTEIGHLNTLNLLVLSENKLSGKLPIALGNFITLAYLHMDGNLFEGNIPGSFSFLKGMQELDLSQNNLTGEIPKFMESLASLQYVNLSFNHFEGEVPTGGIFKNASAVSVIGNNKLCGGLPQLHLVSCSDKNTKRQGRSLSFKYVVTIIIGTISCILLSGLFVIYYWRKRSRSKAPSLRATQEKYMKLSYKDLLKSTNGFSTSNLIGEGSFGSVYKGNLENVGLDIAIKVLNLRQNGTYKSFLAECEALRNARHRNLLKVKTACSSVDFKGNDFKALVFEFMANGSVEQWLHSGHHGGDPSRYLSFIQRLDIASEVSSALDYLHNHCDTPIIHCDIKPSNILLDGDMVVHVSDFGLAKILVSDIDDSSSKQTPTSGLRGSIGYIPPEYGISCEVTTKGDVYSYGVLLLEMFTGRRPTDAMFTDDFSISKYARMVFPERVMEIVDKELLLKEEVNEEMVAKCLILLIKIGISCTNEAPKERMAINNVFIELQTVKDIFLGNGSHADHRHNWNQIIGEGPSYLSHF